MWTYIASSLASGSALYLPWSYMQLTIPVEEEEVVAVEERCCHLVSSVGNLIGGRHSFLVVTTKTGRCVRFDYYPESQQIFTTTNYWELIPQELFRRSVVPPGTKVRDVQSVFQRHVWSQNYSPWSHNCQHVVLSTYNSLTNHQDVVLRNDYLLSFANYLPAYLRNRFLRFDADYASAAIQRRELISEMTNADDQMESLWRLMKAARFDLVTKLINHSPGLTAKGNSLTLKQTETLKKMEKGVLAPLEQYEKELLAWEKTKN